MGEGDRLGGWFDEVGVVHGVLVGGVGGDGVLGGGGLGGDFGALQAGEEGVGGGGVVDGF